MNNYEITEKTVFTTSDGIEFDSRALAEHHVKVCNVLLNCFFESHTSRHYQTIWDLLKRNKISERDDVEYDQLDFLDDLLPMPFWKRTKI
jgi:hypothetical protein